MNKIKSIILCLMLLILFPVNVFAVSGIVSFSYKNSSSEVYVTLNAKINSGTLTKYTTELVLSDNLTFQSFEGAAGFTGEVTDLKLVVTGEPGVTGNAPIGQLVFTKTNSSDFSVSTKNSEICENDSCKTAYNTKIAKTSSNDGPINNPNTGLYNFIGLGILGLISLFIYFVISKKKIFKRI